MEQSRIVTDEQIREAHDVAIAIVNQLRLLHMTARDFIRKTASESDMLIQIGEVVRAEKRGQVAIMTEPMQDFLNNLPMQRSAPVRFGSTTSWSAHIAAFTELGASLLPIMASNIDSLDAGPTLKTPFDLGCIHSEADWPLIDSEALEAEIHAEQQVALRMVNRRPPIEIVDPKKRIVAVKGERQPPTTVGAIHSLEKLIKANGGFVNDIGMRCDDLKRAVSPAIRSIIESKRGPGGGVRLTCFDSGA